MHENEPTIMSEAFNHHEPGYDDVIVPFERKHSQLRSLYSGDMTDGEIGTALDQLDQDEIRHIEAEQRPQFILNDVLLALGITPEMNSLFLSDESLDPARKADARHGLEVDRTLSRVKHEFDELATRLDRAQMADYREAMFEKVSENLSDTNLYRAFNYLRDTVVMSHEVRMNGLVQAHRLCYALLYDHLLKTQAGE